MDVKIRNFLDDIKFVSMERYEIVLAIRELFHNTNSVLGERIKYGGLTYSLSDELIGGIFSYKGHVSIEFSNGADFPDPDGVLEGSGTRRRHIKIKERKDVEDKSVAFYVQEAMK